MDSTEYRALQRRIWHYQALLGERAHLRDMHDFIDDAGDITDDVTFELVVFVNGKKQRYFNKMVVGETLDALSALIADSDTKAAAV